MAVRHGAPGWRLRPGRWNWGQRSLFFTRLAARPGLQQIDRQQHDEGGQQHDHGDGGGAGVVVLFQFGDDEQRRDFRHHRHIAGDEDDRAVFAGGAREGQREAGHQRWRDGGQDDAAEVCQALAPRLAAASSSSRSASSSTGWTVRTTKGRPMKVSAMTMPSGVNATLMPSTPSRKLPNQPLDEYSAVSVMPATAVGSANGRSTSASMMRLPGNS